LKVKLCLEQKRKEMVEVWSILLWTSFEYINDVMEYCIGAASCIQYIVVEVLVTQLQYRVRHKSVNRHADNECKNEAKAHIVTC
jgi:hypothetical protein